MVRRLREWVVKINTQREGGNYIPDVAMWCRFASLSWVEDNYGSFSWLSCLSVFEIIGKLITLGKSFVVHIVVHVFFIEPGGSWLGIIRLSVYFNNDSISERSKCRENERSIVESIGMSSERICRRRLTKMSAPAGDPYRGLVFSSSGFRERFDGFETDAIPLKDTTSWKGNIGTVLYSRENERSISS